MRYLCVTGRRKVMEEYTVIHFLNIDIYEDFTMYENHSTGEEWVHRMCSMHSTGEEWVHRMW